MGNTEKTQVICKSDCYFSDKITRVCQLGAVELTQTNPSSPILSCNQYVKALPVMRDQNTDIDRAREAGMYLAMKERA